MQNNNVRNLAQKEYKALRLELKSLKDCQTRFLTFAVTATAAILGAVGALTDPKYSILFIAPLAVLLPACSIFFDKARTISRIVGYQRMLEGVFLGEEFKKFWGWENALVVYRIIDRNKVKENGWTPSKKAKFIPELLFKPFKQYWTIVYDIFFYLSIGCVVIALFTTGALSNVLAGRVGYTEVFLGIVIVITLVVLISNAQTVFSLINGKYRYDRNTTVWYDVFNPTDKYKKMIEDELINNNYIGVRIPKDFFNLQNPNNK